MNNSRIKNLIGQAIEKTGLDLRDQVVLTEAATGYFMLTPLIAALASAKKVIALTRDSRFGQAVQVQEATMQLAADWDVEQRIEVIFSREDPRLQLADVVTNLGFVRPIDAALLSRLKPTVAISLMWETWEYRKDDLDLDECQKRNIPVLGTNEHHFWLRTFEYIGYIALKLLLELEIEVFLSNILVLGSGDFARYTYLTLAKAGAEVEWVAPVESRVSWTWLSKEAIRKLDAVVVVEHHNTQRLIGKDGIISPDMLKRLNPGIVIAHVCGNVDQTELDRVGLRYAPGQLAMPGYMSVSTAYVGPKPLIDLHAAGLRVGELLTRARQSGLDARSAIQLVLKQTPLAQAFSDTLF